MAFCIVCDKEMIPPSMTCNKCSYQGRQNIELTARLALAEKVVECSDKFLKLCHPNAIDGFVIVEARDSMAEAIAEYRKDK